MKQIEFRPSDSGPLRAGQLYGMCAEVCDHEKRIDKLEQGAADGGTFDSTGDPGDLTIYFENGNT